MATWAACRWVVVRHAADHVHIAAMLVRQDNGRRVHPYNDFYRAREACRAAERRFGLTPTGAADRAASVEQPTRAELEKAARRGRDEPSRVWLRRAARVAAVQAQDPEQFFRRLTDLGVLVLPRELPRGHLVGYSVAAVGDLNARGLPVWFGGGRLAPDLSLPKLRARWRSAPPPPAPIPPAPGERARPGRAERAAAVADATTAARAAATAIRAARTGQPTDEHAATDTAAGDGHTGSSGSTGGGGAGAPAAAPVGPAVAHATGDLLTALCKIGQRLDDPVPWAVSDGYDDRAARTPTVGQPRRWPAVAGQLRTAAWRLIALRSLNPRRFRGNDGDDDEGFAELVLAAATLAAELAALFEAHRQHARAAAARRVSYTLRQPIGHPTSTAPTMAAVESVSRSIRPPGVPRARPPRARPPRAGLAPLLHPASADHDQTNGDRPAGPTLASGGGDADESRSRRSAGDGAGRRATPAVGPRLDVAGVDSAAAALRAGPPGVVR